LNGGTKLSIVENQFNRKLREVWLTGEAFFEVAKNPEKPFIIHTGTMQTTVRGTSFNVKAYPQLSENVVSVRSGKVEVSDATETFGILTHNKQLTYNTANKKTQIAESDWNDAAGWMEGRMIFNSASILEIQLRLKQHYGLEMEVTGNALKDVQCNAGFKKGASVEEVLERISALYNVKYEIKTNKVIFYNR
jgi:transmembrane sensor